LKVQQRTNLYDNSAYTQKMLDDFTFWTSSGRSVDFTSQQHLACSRLCYYQPSAVMVSQFIAGKLDVLERSLAVA
jgi:hypothetical protein